MPEETPEEKAAREKLEAEEQAKKDKEAEKKPPWGSADEFDAGRAWKLIEGLRDEVKAIKDDRESLRTKVKQHEDSSKSDQEKLVERAESAEKRAVTAEAQAARLGVALDKGLTAVQAKRLVGDTPDDLEKDAEELLASFKQEEGDGQESSARRPKERLRPGAAPGSEPEENDPAKLAEQVSRTGW